MKMESAAWKIASKHFLVPGFLIPGLISIATGLVFYSARINPEATLPVFLLNIFTVVGIWFGVKYYARYISNKYIITNASKIVNLATIYNVMLLTFVISVSVPVSDTYGITHDFTNYVVTMMSGVVTVVAFYLASKKYIKQDSTS
jgi:hypothetical protein